MFGSSFVAFFTVQGFFIGIIFGVLNLSSASGLLIDIFFVTIFFYLFAHLIVSFYYRTMKSTVSNFSKRVLEIDLDRFIYEINKREQRIDDIAIKVDDELLVKDTG